MTWEATDEVTITIQTLAKASRESFHMGEEDMKARILDLISDQTCRHHGCEKCAAYEFLSDLIGQLQ